ncbi:uncharacterized protein B0I36DRAFT_357657 [Microdochium trichocladiopsis]|uniref:Protein Zds1 C-terminal domain-containing protein n=1 Tax=Microdochium trichocladiopsis TaxID=1682393 RepID=A0A9P9BTU3_9PEZI|nr:uncharacterized protein B0I36DRAFT_357657 [Microdochium trichocladiopsis]KAH7040346.1 hypothetical protein B0I36DRAFT_357657 [Microdochium trichocladiopsis]
MMTSPRFRDVGGSFADRRGHNHNLSSDSSHHITETIGGLYGDDDDDDEYASMNNHRPMSFIASPHGGEQIPGHGGVPEDASLRLGRSQSDTAADYHSLRGSQTNGHSDLTLSSISPSRMPSQRSISYDSSQVTSPISPLSPTLKEMQEAEQFPLTNIDNPSDIAQELSNLQALRRMSMDVSNHSDPDLLPFQGVSLMAMPSVAPKGDDDADPSRLLWVPAGVHPELAPSEFKTFVETRVKRMNRRSSEASGSSLSPDGLGRSDSGGLRRKKSMLSRQVDNSAVQGGDKYVDGADRLQRSNSQSSSGPGGLSLDELVNDPTRAVQRLTLESQAADSNLSDDMPILPSVPGMGLRRSTRTTYRKGGSLKSRGGSVRSGERLSFSTRVARQSEDHSDTMGTDAPPEAPPGHGLSRVQSAPIVADDLSRQPKSVRRQQTFSQDITTPTTDQHSEPGSHRWTGSGEDQRTASPIPQIIETPATEDPSHPADHRAFPERSSSQHAASPAVPAIPDEPPARSSRRPNYGSQAQTPSQQVQSRNRPPSSGNGTLDDMAHNVSPIPGNSSTRTDSLTFIPTFSSSVSDDRKPEKKSKKDKSDSESSSKTSPWKWLKSDDKDKKKKDEDSKKSRGRNSSEKPQDNARLDVLQTSIDGTRQKGRDSLVLDRDNVDSKLDEERKKENSRKPGDGKKEKDGLFASIFGGKKKGDRDSSHRKSHAQRPLSPEPAPYRPMKPDVDYHWTRFPILEERAIYRMAHIKLANPRRALYSQVLLSNFMYAYLAKVQAMHPQMQVPISPQQKRLQEEERRRKEQEQQYLEQQQAQESMDRYNFEYHRTNSDQYADQSPQTGDYPEDAEIYDYDHGRDHQNDAAAYGDDNNYGQGDGKDYYDYAYQEQGHGNGHGNGHGDGRRHQGEEEMW